MKTIRARLLWTLLAGLTLTLTAGGAAVYWIAETGLVRQLDAGLTARAQTLASLVKLEPEGLVFESSDAPVAIMEETRFELRTHSGDVLKRSANLARVSLPQRELHEHDLLFEDTVLPGGAEGRVVWLAFRPRVDPDDWQGFSAHRPDPELLVVAAAVDREPVDRALATMLGALIVVGGVVGVTVGVLVAAGVRWGLVPLDRLSRQLEGVSGDTIATRLNDAGAPRELAPVYQELNRMLDRVGLALQRERAFADAAAHELRTPLAELRTTAEVAIKWPDAERSSAALGELLGIGREMERLVESLLLISRADAAAVERASDEVAVASVVHGCLEHVAASIREKGLNLTVKLDERSMFRAPRGAVEIIVRNLIANAVQYTPHHGDIAVTNGRTAEGAVTLVVENGPVHLSEHDLPRLFEPFWRAEKSRSDREHVGLGLTVVHRIAQTIGLRVETALAGNRLQVQVSAIGCEVSSAA